MENNYNEKEARLLRALIARKGMQNIVDTAAEVLGNPLFVCDLGYKIICRSSSGGVDDEFWESLRDHNYSLPEQIGQIMRTGDFGKIYATDEPRTGKYDFAAHPFLAARIRDGGHVMGHICVYGCSAPFQETDKELLILLCKVIAYEMLYRGVSTPYEIPYHTLLTALLEGTLTDARELQMRLECLKISLPKQPRLIVIDFKSTAAQAAIFYVREYLAQRLTHTLSIVYKEQLILLAPESVLKNRLLEESLFGYEENMDYKVGISNTVTELMHLKIYYKQAVDSIRISDSLKLEERLCLYSRLKIYQILLFAKKETDLEFLCDPAILEMQAYDRQYHTDYLHDLEVYLNCGKNINQAAKQACVHKNSMYYRISKMEELFSLSLSDEESCFSLRLSLKILRLLNS